MNLLAPIFDAFGAGVVFLLTHFSILLGLVCAGLIVRRISTERHNPSHTLAWLLFVLLLPYLAVPLYFLFGGRKSRRKAKLKAEVSRIARSISGHESINRTTPPRSLWEESSCCTKGNHFELLPDGETTYRRIINEITQAEHTIHIATYILGNDRCGEHIAEALASRAKEGVAVRLLLDSLGSWNKTRLSRHKIRQAGGEVAMFIPVLPIHPQISSNLRNHRKIAIIDNFRAITGGQNLDNRFLGDWEDADRFTDFSVLTEGPAVAEITRTFISDWSFAAKQSPAKFEELLRYTPDEAGNSTIEVISSGPDIPRDPLWEHILRAVQEFRQHLTIVTPYFIPDEVLLHSMIVKAHTGRHIRLILPLRSNHRVADIARHRALSRLDEAGVEILFYNPGMLHAKLILADDFVALTGSANMDVRSLFVNFEIALAHYTSQDIRSLADWVSKIEKDCITYAEATRDAAFTPSRFSQDVVQLITPLL